MGDKSYLAIWAKRTKEPKASQAQELAVVGNQGDSVVESVCVNIFEPFEFFDTVGDRFFPANCCA